MKNSDRARALLAARQQRGAALVVGLILLVVITLVGVAAMRGTTLQEKMAGNLRDSNLSFQAAEAALRLCENLVERDYQAQVTDYSNNITNTPPRVPLMDQLWPAVPPVPPAAPRQQLWFWSLDNGQVGALFPGIAGNRLDPDPTGVGNRPWWAEAVRNRAWWEGAASNSQPLPPANALEGLINPPRCILEGYVYAGGDNSAEARSFIRAVPTDGVVVKNENQFRREKHFFRNTSRGMGGSENAVSMLQTGVYMNYYVPN
ncbi:MAG: PilX N-terminal domain-containing pilus assembly protein [Candidatus Competibacter sp.]|nr:PilX N-terminal domain-containing pilus assembly protein [Candidatus Competibacter sp.]